ncbi:MAG: response regulator [Bryobacteraceae bacterium]
MATSPKKDAGASPGSHRGEAPAAQPDAAEPERIVTVLAVSPLEDDHLLLRGILGHTNWQIRSVRSWGEARVFLGEHRMPVVICEAHLPDAQWGQVLSELSGMPDAPVLIVTSQVADDALWAEVLSLGGYDLLMKPFDATEVFRVVSLAWLSWRNKRERERVQGVTATHLTATAV